MNCILISPQRSPARLVTPWTPPARRTHRCLILFVVSGILLGAVHCLQGQSESDSAPMEWRPSLDEVAEDIKQRLTEAKPQQELNRLSRQLSDVLDARLFIACVALKKLLREPEQIAFEQEQARWLMERIRLSKAAVSSPKGSLGPLEYSDEFNAVTEKRLREIEGRTATAKPPTKKR